MNVRVGLWRRLSAKELMHLNCGVQEDSWESDTTEWLNWTDQWGSACSTVMKDLKLQELDHKESWALKNGCFWTVVLEKTLESPLDCKEIQPVHSEGDQPWDLFGRNDAEANSSTLATSCEELTHWKRFWCWEGLGAGGDADDRGWDGWMALLIRWTWVWVNSCSWWWTWRPGMLWLIRLQTVGHDWATVLN